MYGLAILDVRFEIQNSAVLNVLAWLIVLIVTAF